MKAQLVVVQGKPEGMVIPLSSPKYKIGRGEGCQLRPNSDLVSREHAQFVVGADLVLVQDLGSRNGTEVNGKRLAANQPTVLKSGDLIKVGTLTFAISIEGAVAAKPVTVVAGGGRKPSLDDVSGDEIDAWLVSDESRPTPDRPSGVYGGDTITLATYNAKDKDKAKPIATAEHATLMAPPRTAPPPSAPAPVAATTAPAPAPAPIAATPPPVPAAPPAPASRPAAPVPPPVPAPVAVAPPPAPIPPPPVPAPVLAAPAPAVPVVAQAAAPAEPEAEREYFNPLFNFLSDAPDLPDAEPEVGGEAGDDAPKAKDDGFADLSSLQDDGGEEAEAAAPVPEDFIDESNPFFVKKPEAAPAKPAPGSADSSSAAGDILRKLMDRKRSK